MTRGDDFNDILFVVFMFNSYFSCPDHTMSLQKFAALMALTFGKFR